MSDIPLVSVIAGFSEFTATGLEQSGDNEVVVFSSASPYSSRTRQDADGWIDVRGHVRMTAVVTTTGNDCNFRIESKRGSNDPDPQDLVATTLVADGTTTELYADQCEYISHVRLTQDGVAAGTTTASILLK